MKHSQQRPFFQAATSEAKSRNCNQHTAATLQEYHFRACARIAVILALLFFTSCASLTPERISVLVQIATQAAQLGAQEWLAAHPEHRAAFQAVIDAINIELRAGNVTKAIAMLHSLPVTSLGGKDGEVYWTGEPKATNAVVEVAAVGTLVVWDGELAKAVRVTGAAERPIVLAVRDGLRRAVAPKPPALPVMPRAGRSAEPPLTIVPEGVITFPQPATRTYWDLLWRTTNAYTLEARPGVSTNIMIYTPGSVSLSTTQPTNALHITPE